MIEINLFEELFLSTSMWGYFGVLGLIVIGYILTKKEKGLGIFFIIVDSLLIANYLALANYEVYMWQVIILLLGILQCTFRLVR
jgi:hypothetical protein